LWRQLRRLNLHKNLDIQVNHEKIFFSWTTLFFCRLGRKLSNLVFTDLKRWVTPLYCPLNPFLGAPEREFSIRAFLAPPETCQKRIESRNFEKFIKFWRKFTVRSVIVGSGENLRAMERQRPFFCRSHFLGDTLASLLTGRQTDTCLKRPRHSGKIIKVPELWTYPVSE